MVLSTTNLTALIGGGLSATWWLNSYIQERRANPHGLPTPPGLKGLPVIGSLLDFPTEKPWLVYNDWHKTYGDLVFFTVLGQNFLVLGSNERASDLFEKRSNNYSDRPRMPMILELMEGDYHIGLLPYGSWWRRHRRLFHSAFHSNIVARYQPIQLSATRTFLRNLLKTPEDFMQLIRLSFATIIMKVAYGITVTDMDDPYVTEAEAALRGIAEAGTVGKFLVDMIPIMKYIPSWFPGAEFQRKAARWRAINHRVAHRPFDLVKQKMKEGKAVHCVATELIEALPDENSPDRQDEETLARHTCAVAYAGGSDTTVSSVQSFFMAMCMYPEVQKKAQAEIDRVVKGRLPEFNDRPSLPYIDSLVKETIRWQPVGPLGVVHMATEADEYDGYYIPKGTLVFGNSWSILHDPVVFENPFDYNPDRYLKDGKAYPEMWDSVVAAFGFGRRICPGRYFSDNSLFSIIAHVLAVYDIRPGLDTNGKEIEIKPEVTSGLISYPLPFPCRITPRSKAAEKLIKNSELME